MFYSYRKFNKSSKKRIYILVGCFIILIIWGVVAYKGINFTPKLVTKELVIPE